MVAYSNWPTSPRTRNTWLVRDGWQIQIKAGAAFLSTSRACMDFLLIIKVKIFVFTNMIIYPPPLPSIMLTIQSRMVNIL